MAALFFYAFIEVIRMDAYIKRLYACGYSMSEAYKTLTQILKEYGMSAVIKYVQEVERDKCLI